MGNVTFKIRGMHCSGCAATVQAVLLRHGGVKSASAAFEAVVKKAGFRVTERRAGI